MVKYRAALSDHVWVSDVMTRTVVTLSPKMTLEQAAERLVEKGISGAPVVDEQGRLVGVLSESDLLRRLKTVADETVGRRYLTEPVHSLALLTFLSDRHPGTVDEVYRKLRALPVADAMTRKVETVKPTDSLETVAALMIQHDVNRIPVVDGGRIVGIVTRTDLARVLAQGRKDVPRL
jgi:CBS domain-containing protein